jgi:serine/threonine protein kinase
MSEWGGDKRALCVDSDMDVLDERPQRPKLVRRPKGVYRLTDFIIQRTLGTGSFGRVHLGLSFAFASLALALIYFTVRSKHNLRFYAIKVLNKERVVKMKQVEHTNNEQRMLECVQHPFIINLWGYFQDTANLYMVMDFVPGGELFTLLRRSNVTCPYMFFCCFY